MSQLTFETRIQKDHLVRLPDELPVGARIRITVEPLPATGPGIALDTTSALGRRLAAIRRRAIDSGMTLQSADEILAEVHEGRGEAGDDQDLR